MKLFRASSGNRKRKISWITIIYIVLASAAFAIAVIDPSNDPLSGIFTIPLAMPWILFTDSLVSENHVMNMGIVLCALILNAFILHLVSRLWMREGKA